MSWNKQSANFILSNYKKMDIAEIARHIGKKPKTVNAWLNRNGYYKRPNYTETETFLLTHFPAKLCKPFIPHKSSEALRVKRFRILKEIKNQKIVKNATSV